ncbi:hypothetical protein A7X67_13435 [Clostridium sp. W14A]|nr:hypothetical protein A7X67_13435 [Clostridium sp. W14A]
MKAHIQKSASDTREIRVSGDGPYHGHPIRLSIGMIVKNEEKTLDRCLSSLKPLMEAVESELIITDTGSTDSTVEIAKKYTDHIIHFEWCDDFSAARNTGLKEARGEWFMFLDGDEWFENTDELIEFFTSGECDKYGSAAYIQRNYSRFDGSKYSDFPVQRVTRMYDGIHFEHIVHEDFGRVAPTKFLNDYANHYGYIYTNSEDQRKKLDRNRTLLKREIEENPKNLKAYAQLSTQCLMDDLEQAEKYCNVGLKIVEESHESGWRFPLLHTLSAALYNSKKYEKLLRLIEKLVMDDPKMEVLWLDFCCYAQSAAFALGDYQRSIKHGNQYLEIYKRYQEGRLDREITLVVSVAFSQPRHREQALRLKAEAEYKLGNYIGAEEVLNQLDFSSGEDVLSDLKIASRIYVDSKDENKLADVYEKISRCSTKDLFEQVRQHMALLIPMDTDAKARFLDAFAGAPLEEDSFVHLCRLKKAGLDDEHESILWELNWFSQRKGNRNSIYADVLFYAMKEKQNILPFLLIIDSDDFGKYGINMQKQHSDFLYIVKQYLQLFSFEHPKGLYWSICLRERILLTGNSFQVKDEEIRFFEEYARQCERYTRMLYRPELLSPDRILILPRFHRFGYLIGCALSARDKVQFMEYISYLKQALTNYPVMKDPINLLLKQFEEEDKLRKEKAEEFNVLAAQVKKNIQDLISQGNLKEAGRYTVQLAALLPNDPDVVKFRTITHTEPDMNELAARLPQ